MSSRVFKTNRQTRVALAICLWPCAALGIAAAFDGAVLEGTALAVAFTLMWLWFTTLAVEISAHSLSIRRLGRVVWAASLDDINAHFGRGGELKTHTALILESPKNTKSFQLLKTMFGADQLGRIAKILEVKQSVPGGVF